MTLKELLELFPEVKWDRYTNESQGEYENFDFYGWIDREDNRSDFLLLNVIKVGENYKPDGFTTSSASLSSSFALRLGWQENHIECKRVENLTDDAENVIRLKEQVKERMSNIKRG